MLPASLLSQSEIDATVLHSVFLFKLGSHAAGSTLQALITVRRSSGKSSSGFFAHKVWIAGAVGANTEMVFSEMIPRFASIL